MSCTTATAVNDCLTELFALAEALLESSQTMVNPFNSKEWYPFTDKYGFKHKTLGPHYFQSIGFIERHVCTTKWMLNKAKASRVPLPQAICPNLPSSTEILHNWTAGPCVPGQQNPIPKNTRRFDKHSPDASKNKRKPMTTGKMQNLFPTGI